MPTGSLVVSKNSRHAHFWKEPLCGNSKGTSSVMGKDPLLEKSQLNSEARQRRPKSAFSNVRLDPADKHFDKKHTTGGSGQEDRLHLGVIRNQRPKSGIHRQGDPLLHKQLGPSKLCEFSNKVRIGTSIRPLSAPVTEQKRRRGALKSAKGRYGVRSNGSKDQANEKDMFNVLQLAKEAKQFEEDTTLFRDLEKSLQGPSHEDDKDTPVFNKRLFASQGTVIMTQEARRLMVNNTRANSTGDVEAPISKSDVHCLRCITDGLKLIHKGQDFVKDVLSRVVTYEVYDAFQSVPKKTWEEALSCYYILNGAVEVTYDMRARQSRNVYQANIIYSHGTGEYVGLVSPEGPSEDLAPPATIYTKELTQFIRVDRTRFHKIMETAKEIINERKKAYISNHSFLAKVPSDVREKILHKLSIQEYPANRVLLAQGEMTDYLFVVMKGRCQTYREVYIPEAGKDVLFYLTSRDQDDFFGEECLLDQTPSYCTVVTATPITCLRLHKSALQIVNKDRLVKFIEAERHEFLSPEELMNKGYKDSVWNKFKYEQIKESLKEAGKMKYLNKAHCAPVLDRPPGEEECHTENMRRFVMKGSSFEPVRVKSATMRKTPQKVPTRPQTAFVKRDSRNDLIKTDEENDVPDRPKSTLDHKSSSLLTAAKAKEIEKKIAKAMDSKEAMMKLLEENADMGSNLQQAFKLEELQDKETFMKTGVLVTMTSADIVRKAKALADTYADKWKDRAEQEGEEEWNTILHAENKQAKFLISANRMRLRDIKRRMIALQKKREKLGLTKYAPKDEAEDAQKTLDEHPTKPVVNASKVSGEEKSD